MIVRIAKEPRIFVIQPIRLWLSRASLIALFIVAVLIGWIQEQSAAERSALLSPAMGSMK